MGEPIINSEEYGRDLPRDVWQMLVIRDAHIKELEKAVRELSDDCLAHGHRPAVWIERALAGKSK